MLTPSNVAHPALVLVVTNYDEDACGAAEALVALLRNPPPADYPIAETEDAGGDAEAIGG